MIVIGILLMALGAWLGYRYISEQDEIRPKIGFESSNTKYWSVHICETTSNTAVGYNYF